MITRQKEKFSSLILINAAGSNTNAIPVCECESCLKSTRHGASGAAREDDNGGVGGLRLGLRAAGRLGGALAPGPLQHLHAHQLGRGRSRFSLRVGQSVKACCVLARATSSYEYTDTLYCEFMK